MATPYILEPDLLLCDGALLEQASLGVGADGRFCAPTKLPKATPKVRLTGRVLLPGLVNAHSHAFQRLIRGRTEFLTPGRPADDFWTWRERMYHAANALGPEDVYVASRQAFLEMALCGITTVGEFHYLHHGPNGEPYHDRNELALQVIRAARDVGLRVALLRVGYARTGYEAPDNPLQRRFYDGDVDGFLAAVEGLRGVTKGDPAISVGAAPHSVRAVPRGWLERVAQVPSGVVHMHVAEQAAEVAACQAEHGRRPFELLHEVGLLSERFTAVHGVELSQREVALLGMARARVCVCPSTERNLGDGVVEADLLQEAGVSLCLGTDSQAEIDLFSEARLLEGHLRLLRKRRAVLDKGDRGPNGLSAQLLNAATLHGAESLAVEAGALRPGLFADAVALDLAHPSMAGLSPKAGVAQLLFGAAAAAVREVWVGGHKIVSEGAHPLAAQSGQEFSKLARRVFA
jgi:formimidoylglutamate deiminase